MQQQGSEFAAIQAASTEHHEEHKRQRSRRKNINRRGAEVPLLHANGERYMVQQTYRVEEYSAAL